MSAAPSELRGVKAKTSAGVRRPSTGKGSALIARRTASSSSFDRRSHQLGMLIDIHTERLPLDAAKQVEAIACSDHPLVPWITTSSPGVPSYVPPPRSHHVDLVAEAGLGQARDICRRIGCGLGHDWLPGRGHPSLIRDVMTLARIEVENEGAIKSLGAIRIAPEHDRAPVR